MFELTRHTGRYKCQEENLLRTENRSHLIDLHNRPQLQKAQNVDLMWSEQFAPAGQITQASLYFSASVPSPSPQGPHSQLLGPRRRAAVTRPPTTRPLLWRSHFLHMFPPLVVAVFVVSFRPGAKTGTPSPKWKGQVPFFLSSFPGREGGCFSIRSSSLDGAIFDPTPWSVLSGKHCTGSTQVYGRKFSGMSTKKLKCGRFFPLAFLSHSKRLNISSCLFCIPANFWGCSSIWMFASSQGGCI